MKRFLALLILSAAMVPSMVQATPITLSFDFTFDQNSFHLTEVPVTGSVTFTLNNLPAGSGYTTDGSVDALAFNIPGLGLQPATTNYLKMLFDGSGHMTYLLVSDRSDFSLSAIPPTMAGYTLALKGTDLLTGTGIAIGSNFGSTFGYYIDGRRNVDIAYTFTTGAIAKVDNPVATVPDAFSTLGLLGIATLGLVGFRRRASA